MAKRREKERRRGKRRENRHERRQQQHAGGGEWDVMRLPDGVEVFKPQAGETYNMDIIPYIVGDYNKSADKGDEYFELSYPVYRSLGVEGKKFIAIGELLDSKDPVAEHFARLRKAGEEWDAIKIFKPTWRQIMLVFVHEQADKGLQLYEGAYGTFGELLDEEIKANEDEHVDNFDDPDGGSTLVVRWKQKNIGQTNPWTLASKINFRRRKDGFTADGNPKLAAEVLDKAAGICLDELLKIPSYDVLQKALDGEPLSEEESGASDGGGDDKNRRRTRRPKQEAEETPQKEEQKPPTARDLGIATGDEVQYGKHKSCTVLRITGNGHTLTIMDDEDDGEVYKGVDVTEVRLVGSDGEEEKPNTSPAKPNGQQEEDGDGGKDEDDWDDGWGDEDDEDDE